MSLVRLVAYALLGPAALWVPAAWAQGTPEPAPAAPAEAPAKVAEEAKPAAPAAEAKPAEAKPAEVKAPEVKAAEVKPPEVKPEPKKESPWTDRIKFSGKAYLRYSYEIDPNRANYNEFDVDRIYLTTDAKLTDDIVFSLTLEGGDLRESGTDYFDVATKGIYIDIQNLLMEGTSLKLGQVNLPWVPYEEGVWGYRFQGTIFPDRTGYMTSTDLGGSFSAKLPSGYGNFQINVGNGEGWKKNEIGKRKEIHGRLTLNPLASMKSLSGLFISGFGSIGYYDDAPAPMNNKRRYMVQLGYKQEGKGLIAAEYLLATDPADKMKSRYPSLSQNAGNEASANGYSVFGMLNLGALMDGDYPTRWELIARWDHLDPDSAVANNDVDLWIGGASYRWNKHLQSILDYERVRFQSNAGKPSEERVMLQTEVKF
ncbi:MAG: hypothetical protein HYZ28_09075 [Myxococcales bacterium]|nr:hypothetical protein [Myxococcales bacterium]